MTTEPRYVNVKIYKCGDCPHFYDGGWVGEDWCVHPDNIATGYIDDPEVILDTCPYLTKENDD